MDAVDNDGIAWGKVAKGSYKGNISYLSFFYEGEEYELYDNVFLYVESVLEPDIGKIVALWEEKNTKRKRMLVRWFLRPTEFIKFDLDTNSKELFLAYGEGRGVTNENDLEAILGKCKVLCTSKDPQNIQPSESDHEDADYYFYRVYDVNQRQFYNVERVVRRLGHDQVYNKPVWVSSYTEAAYSRRTRLSKLSKRDGIGASKPTEVIENPSLQADISNSSKRTNAFHHCKRVNRGSVRCLPSETNKRLRDFEIIAEDSKKRFHVETYHTKQGVDSGGLKKPLTHLDEPKHIRKVKALEEINLSPMRRFSSKSPGLSLGLAESPNNAVKSKGYMQEDDKSQCMEPEVVQSSPLSLQIGSLSTLDEFIPGITDRVANNSFKADIPVCALDHGTGIELDCKSVSVQPEHVLDKHQGSSKGNASIDTAPQGTLAAPILLCKLDKFSDSFRNEGDLIGTDKGEAAKVSETSTVVGACVSEGGEEKERRLHKSKSIDGKLLNRKIATPSITSGGKQKDTERQTSGQQMSEATADNKVSFCEETRADISEKTALLRDKEAAGAEIKSAPWKENLHQGISQGRVLILQNLSPSLTSMDVYDILNCIFQGCIDAQMIPQDGTSPSGQALAIFENKSFAECALRDLEENCLVLIDGNRPLVASMAKPPVSGKIARFPGHFPLEKFKLSRQLQIDEMRKGVSSTHCLQTNTVEFEMAMEWRYLQETVLKCWNDLYKIQKDETKEVLQKYKQQNFSDGKA